jgi:hypothetical protein
MFNQISQSKLIALAAFVLFSSAPFLSANDVIVDPGPGAPRTSPGDMTFGYSFRAGDDSTIFTITALGIWDQGGDGLANSHEVGLWFSSGPGVFVLGASYVANDADLYRANFDPQSATFGAGAQGGIAFESGAGTGFAYPNLYDGIGQYVGPSAQFTIQAAVPEPSVWIMLGVGAVLLLLAKGFRSRPI